MNEEVLFSSCYSCTCCQSSNNHDAEERAVIRLFILPVSTKLITKWILCKQLVTNIEFHTFFEPLWISLSLSPSVRLSVCGAFKKAWQQCKWVTSVSKKHFPNTHTRALDTYTQSKHECTYARAYCRPWKHTYTCSQYRKRCGFVRINQLLVSNSGDCLMLGH